jgi:hypothetical protein
VQGSVFACCTSARHDRPRQPSSEKLDTGGLATWACYAVPLMLTAGSRGAQGIAGMNPAASLRILEVPAHSE